MSSIGYPPGSDRLKEFEKRLAVADDLLLSGALLGVSLEDKELLTVFATQGCFDRLIEYARRTPEALEAVLHFFVDLAVVDVNSYDERLGVMSALVYFLTERERYSIDIQWAWRKATVASNFLDWLINSVLDTEFAPTGLLLLAFVLNNYPPTRVTPLIWAVLLKPENLKKIVQCIAKAEERAATDEDPPVALHCNIFNSILNLGLGMEFREINKEIYALNYFESGMSLGVRCACSMCDLHRIARKAVKHRDEFPIPENHEIARTCCKALLKTGVEEVLLGIIQNRFRKWIAADVSVESERCLQHFISIVTVLKVTNVETAIYDAFYQFGVDYLSQLPLNMFTITLGGFGPGVRSVIVWVSMESKEKADESTITMLRRLLLTTSDVINSCDLTDAGNTRFLWLLPLLALLYTAGDLEGDSAVVRCVCNFCDGLENQILNGDPQDSLDSKRLMRCLSLCVAIICGVVEYASVPEVRRPVLAPPHSAAGYLISHIRQLLGAYRRFSCCVYIKCLLNVSLMRSEQASGLRKIVV